MPVANIAEARDLMVDVFKVAWDAGVESAGVLVIYPDSGTERPKTTVPYVVLTVEHNDGGRATIGGKTSGRRFRRFGIITAQIFTPFGGGLTLSDALTTIVLDAYETADPINDKITYEGIHPQEVGQSGAWHQMNVLVSFSYDEVK
jgi:hypothetical protein